MQSWQKKFRRMWEERDPEIVVQTQEEAVILASIVEKETSRADERPLIASVFQNRLRKKMRLQSDPTIIYGLVGGKGVLDHPIQQEELERETAYNTYKINGLPPTPIANPGRAAIEAVLKPAKTKDLIFRRRQRRHAFAASLDEHNKNVAVCQIERAKREQERAEAAAAAAVAAQGSPDGAASSPDGSVVPKSTGGATGAPAPGTLVAPDEPLDGQSSAVVSPATGEAGAAPAEASSEGGAGTGIPLPKRNPLR
jgi:UPF0755 protein